MTLVVLDLQQIHIRLVGTVRLHLLAIHMQWCLAAFVKICLPESIEVLRILGIGFQLFRRETHLHMMLVLVTVFMRRESQIQKSRFLHRPHVDSGSAVFQLHFALAGGRHHIWPDLITHLYVLRHTIKTEHYFYLCFLSHLIQPVGMIGYRQPQVI